jgi:hypothetical protein
MPPRYAYWTILIDGHATAFRAREREELLPTFNQLARKNADIVMRYFARGRLWDNPEQAQWANRNRETAGTERRDRDWRPGGQHQDPRARPPGKPGWSGKAGAAGKSGRPQGAGQPGRGRRTEKPRVIGKPGWAEKPPRKEGTFGQHPFKSDRPFRPDRKPFVPHPKPFRPDEEKPRFEARSEGRWKDRRGPKFGSPGGPRREGGDRPPKRNKPR